MRCSIVLSLILLAAPAFAQSLVFQRSGKDVATLTAEEISAKIPPVTVKFFHYELHKEKSYRCWPIKDVMALAFGAGWEKGEFPTVSLAAADGYVSTADAARLTEDGGCLAFADADAPDWEPIGRKRANPGPFYLVWSKPEQSVGNAYPRPFQLVSINLVRF